MVAFDWGALIEATLTAFGDVITAVVAALTTNADQIASILIMGLIGGAVVKFGTTAFAGLANAVKGLFN